MYTITSGPFGRAKSSPRDTTPEQTKRQRLPGDVLFIIGKQLIRPKHVWNLAQCSKETYHVLRSEIYRADVESHQNPAVTYDAPTALAWAMNDKRRIETARRAIAAATKPKLVEAYLDGIEFRWGRRFKARDSPIHVAVDRGTLEMVKILLDAGCNANIPRRHRLAPPASNQLENLPQWDQLARGPGGVGGFQLANSSQWNVPEQPHRLVRKISPIGLAVYNNDIHKAHMLLPHTSILMIEGMYSALALHNAVQWQNVFMVRIILEHRLRGKTNVRRPGTYPESAIHTAVHHNTDASVKIIRLLVDYGANIESRSCVRLHNRRDTPLEIAIKKQNVKCARVLVSLGASTAGLSCLQRTWLQLCRTCPEPLEWIIPPLHAKPLQTIAIVVVTLPVYAPFLIVCLILCFILVCTRSTCRTAATILRTTNQLLVVHGWF